MCELRLHIALLGLRYLLLLQGEKESSGLPDAPSSAGGKVIEVEYASIADRKLRGSLKDPGFLEAQVTALQVRGGIRAWNAAVK